MYEGQTYEVILNRMLDRVPGNLDKREGSIIYDALAPAAAELAQMYIELGVTRNRISVDSATGDDLTELAYQRSVFRRPATNAIRLGVFNTEVPIGSRFGAERLTYKVTEKVEDYEYKLECEQPGEIGNSYAGKILPIDYINGLSSATLTEVIIPGAEEEPDSLLRTRLRNRIIRPAQDGNTAQYLEWAENFEGVGAAKPFPLWNGGNTMKIAIANRLYQPADPALVSALQEYLDPGSQGLGNGVAPVGAIVTVTSGTAKEINIAGDITIAQGYVEPEGVEEAIKAYLASITYVSNSVSYTRLTVAILDTPSIADLSNLTVNGGTSDVPLVGDEIPVLGNLNLTVVSP